MDKIFLILFSLLLLVIIIFVTILSDQPKRLKLSETQFYKTLNKEATEITLDAETYPELISVHLIDGISPTTLTIIGMKMVNLFILPESIQTLILYLMTLKNYPIVPELRISNCFLKASIKELSNVTHTLHIAYMQNVHLDEIPDTVTSLTLIHVNELTSSEAFRNRELFNKINIKAIDDSILKELPEDSIVSLHIEQENVYLYDLPLSVKNLTIYNILPESGDLSFSIVETLTYAGINFTSSDFVTTVPPTLTTLILDDVTSFPFDKLEGEIFIDTVEINDSTTTGNIPHSVLNYTENGEIFSLASTEYYTNNDLNIAPIVTLDGNLFSELTNIKILTGLVAVELTIKGMPNIRFDSIPGMVQILTLEGNYDIKGLTFNPDRIIISGSTTEIKVSQALATNFTLNTDAIISADIPGRLANSKIFLQDNWENQNYTILACDELHIDVTDSQTWISPKTLPDTIAKAFVKMPVNEIRDSPINISTIVYLESSQEQPLFAPNAEKLFWREYSGGYETLRYNITKGEIDQLNLTNESLVLEGDLSKLHKLDKVVHLSSGVVTLASNTENTLLDGTTFPVENVSGNPIILGIVNHENIPFEFINTLQVKYLHTDFEFDEDGKIIKYNEVMPYNNLIAFSSTEEIKGTVPEGVELVSDSTGIKRKPDTYTPPAGTGIGLLKDFREFKIVEFVGSAM